MTEYNNVKRYEIRDAIIHINKKTEDSKITYYANIYFEQEENSEEIVAGPTSLKMAKSRLEKVLCNTTSISHRLRLDSINTKVTGWLDRHEVDSYTTKTRKQESRLLDNNERKNPPRNPNPLCAA